MASARGSRNARSPMILAADIGGTKSLLGLFERRAGRLVCRRSDEFASAAFPSFERMVRSFLAEGGERPTLAVAGVAGPVVRGRTHVVNLKWSVSEAGLSRAIGGAPATVLNDLEAAAWGIPELRPGQTANLTPGLRPGAGNGALIAAGTGLGMAILARRGGAFVPLASEGGHQDFAPRDETECALLDFMKRRLGKRVSVERLVAGPGFSAIYDFLVATGRGRLTRAMKKRLAARDPNAVVSEAGVRSEDATAERAVDLFVSLYGAAAGNLALVARASGGLWLSGGITPKILPKLLDGAFLEAFRDKGRLRPFLEAVPIKAVLEPRLALLGAAAHALRDPTR